jgi:hypothetical protein
MIDITQASIVLAGLTILVGILILGGGLAFFGIVVRREYPLEVTIEEEESPIDAALLAKRSSAYRLGAMVLAGLAVLTIVEYLLGVTWPSVIILLVIGLLKAGLIVQYFMHVTRVWSEERH